MFRISSFPVRLGSFALGGAFLFAACGGGGGERRVIPITQTDGSCEPGTISVKAGEKVQFAITNNSGKDKEIEGIEGTKVDEVLVPSGKTRNVNYTAPGSAGTGKIQCYLPGGDTTIIQLEITG